MPKLKLNPEPTFKAKVAIPVKGGDSAEVLFTFKSRTRDEMKDFSESRKDKTDLETFSEMVVGWDLDDAFNPENVERLLQNYIGAGVACYMVYMDEHYKHKAGN
jgi:hypothetical protein